MSNMPYKTALHMAHQTLRARMVEFCGWEMPLHYGSQIEEHHAVRRDCGIFDIAHMCAVDILGADAHAFLCRLLANNIAKLHPGRALYSCMLNQAGGIMDDLIVYDCGKDGYRLVVNACTSGQDLAWMAGRAADLHYDVSIIPRRDLAMLAVQGPNARKKVWQVLPHIRSATADMAAFHAAKFGDLFIALTGYTGEDGFEISLPAEKAGPLWQKLLEAGAKPCGLGARDTLRLEAGMCLYGQEMDETVTPFEAGLGWTVDLNGERDFIGRTALQVRPQRWQTLGLLLPQGGIMRHGHAVRTPLGPGTVTSGSFSPSLQRAVALARLPLGVAAGDTVMVEIRGKELAARVVTPPFIRRGKILV
jgi:aminomethyltransferase